MIYSSYEISLQNFKRICPAVKKLCFLQAEENILYDSYLILVRFFAQFFIVYLIMIYFSYEISLQNFKRIRAAIGKLCFRGRYMTRYLILVRFFAQFLYCLSHYDLL